MTENISAEEGFGLAGMVLSAIIGICIFGNSLEGVNNRARINETEKRIEYFASSELRRDVLGVQGIDSNKDGYLDSAKYTVPGSPRCPSPRFPIDKDSKWFSELQSEYYSMFNKR